MMGSTLPHLNLQRNRSISINFAMVRERSFEKPCFSGKTRAAPARFGELPDLSGKKIVFEEAIFLRRSCGDTITIDAKVVGSAVRGRARADDASCGALRDRDNGGVIFVRGSRNSATIHSRSQNQRCVERLSQG